MSFPLEHHIPGIQKLCRDHHIKTLHVFGSVLRHDFRPDSDIDFLVVFDHSHQPSSFVRFFEFKEALESMLSHPVDLIAYEAIRNPFFKLEIEETKHVVFAA